jgi:hypothetical protein
MAHSGYTTLQLYYSTTPTAVPQAADLTIGELGFNVADGKVYYKTTGGSVAQLTGLSGSSGYSGYSGSGVSGYSGATGTPSSNVAVIGGISGGSGYFYPTFVTSSASGNYTLETSPNLRFGLSGVTPVGLQAEQFTTYPAYAPYYNAYSYVDYNAIGWASSTLPANIGIFASSDTLQVVVDMGVGKNNYVFDNTFFGCGNDNVASLGRSINRWTAVYAVNGTIQTSDENEKTEIANLDDAEKRVALRLKGLIKKFKFKDAVAKKGANNARIHVGVIAQDVKDAFTAEGLDPYRYGVFCYDEWQATPESVDEKGRVMAKAQEAGSRYGVRYDELLAFIISAL